jgi:hypothetical protein
MRTASTVTAAALPLLDAPGIRDRNVATSEALAAALASPAADGPERAVLASPAADGPERAALGSPAADGPGRAAWRVLGAGPFRLQLVCPGEAARDALLRHLATHQIFAPVHWRQHRASWWSGDEEAADLADRMLTVPVDHRCSPSDVRRIADVLLSFPETTTAAPGDRAAAPVTGGGGGDGGAGAEAPAAGPAPAA